jgi:hypothetical protein
MGRLESSAEGQDQNARKLLHRSETVGTGPALARRLDRCHWNLSGLVSSPQEIPSYLAGLFCFSNRNPLRQHIAGRRVTFPLCGSEAHATAPTFRLELPDDLRCQKKIELQPLVFHQLRRGLCRFYIRYPDSERGQFDEVVIRFGAADYTSRALRTCAARRVAVKRRIFWLFRVAATSSQAILSIR